MKERSIKDLHFLLEKAGFKSYTGFICPNILYHYEDFMINISRIDVGGCSDEEVIACIKTKIIIRLQERIKELQS